MASVPSNPTQLTPPRVALIDERSGAISREWYRFFLSLLNATESTQQEATLAPDATSLLASYDAMLETLTQTTETQPESASVSALAIAQSDIQSLALAPPGNSGSVTSVDASGGATGLTFSGGPITSSGTLTLGGTLAITNGGTGAITAAAARTNLGATTLGGNVFTITNPSAVTFPRFNADNTVSALDAATFRTAIGAGTGSGSVTSVSGAGTVNGITLTGTVTSSGSLTLGGTLSGVSLTTQVSGTLPVANGGTNSTATPAAGGVAYGTGTAYAVNAAGTSGQVLTSAGAAAPTWTTPTTGTVTSVTGTAPVVSSGGSTPAISMAAATTSVNGYLTSTDWTTFNNKGSGTVTSVSGTGTVNGITLTGTVTSSGSLTLGGTLSGVSLTTQVSGTLPVANGGTNASTFTAGSVVFAGASGTYTQKNASFFWDNTNNRLGIGTAAPASALDVVGSITASAGIKPVYLIGSAIATVINWDGAQFYPGVDGTILLGFPTFRWNTVYATTGTINTSDGNEKQDINLLNDAEKNVAVRLKSLVRSFKFNDAVAAKGAAARVHFGLIAQDVASAFEAEGLDPQRYAMFCSDTWYEVDGKPSSDVNDPFTKETEGAVEKTRLGLRYDELIVFMISVL